MIESYKKNLFIEFSGWFIKLADYAERAEDKFKLPKLELILHTGNIIRGSIIGYDRSRQEKMLMVLTISDSNPKSEITLIPGAQIAAITFLDANKTLMVLEDRSIVSTLELKRTNKQIEEDLEKITENKIHVLLDTDHYPENQRKYILETIKMLPSIFESLMDDELGKKAIDENIKNIKILISQNNKTILDDKELQIEITPDYKFPEKEKQRIKKEIESVL
ncbi:hypothetical protein [Flavobacterium limi]|uniref:Uncharacterized protein n=1 Tax=Flavobacterium limi TaxID=2045105 RepID=A0ABQ1UKR1_9FLAO|nr:hypothetical protein [Flavobacterium limi]GGF21430.1 hypothetical protein GCM10011518_33270 [Flavobacterium limi]